MSFARSIRAVPFPAESSTIEKYIAFKFTSGKKYGSIRTGVTAVSFIHKMNDKPDPTKSYRISRLFRGVKRNSKTKSKLLPISYSLLLKILDRSYSIVNEYEKISFQSIILLLYYGCLRIGELVKSGEPKHMINTEGIKFLYNKTTLTGVRITLDSFKHSDDPVTFKINCAPGNYCPVLTLLKFISLRGCKPGKIFLKSNGKWITRDFIASHVKTIVSSLGLNKALYNTHSFRIGRASDLAKKGVPDQVIKKIGRWESSAYTRYIRFEDFTVPAP